MDIEIAVCTHNERILGVERMLLPEQEGLAYLVAWQRTTPEARRLQLPEGLARRADVRVVMTDTAGLSVNRNVALCHARGDVVVIADDDCRYTTEGIGCIRKAYALHPRADVVTFRMNDLAGRPMKCYPSEPFLWPKAPKGFYVSSWELTLSRRACRVGFDPHFGIGSPFLASGEEEVWLHDVARALPDAELRYEPLTIGRTEAGTTGTRFLTDAGVQRAKGAVLGVIHPWWGALPRLLKEAFTARCGWGQRMAIWIQMMRGFAYLKRRRG